MNSKVKKVGYTLLHYLVAVFVLWLHGFHLGPALWNQGSSTAFDIDMAIWVILIFWISYLLLPILCALHSFWQKLRGVPT